MRGLPPPNLVKSIGFGAMLDPTTSKFTWFGAIGGPINYEFMRFGFMEITCP
jgi:hypothetical protein